MKTFIFKKVRKFILSLFSLLFFVFCTIGIVSASDYDENNLNIVIVKQIAREDLNDKLKNIKLKKEQVNNQTENRNELSTIYYVESLNHKKEKSNVSQTFFQAVASSSIGIAVKSVFDTVCGLFKHKPKNDNNSMKVELEKIIKN